jgi:hypothetical protein
MDPSQSVKYESTVSQENYQSTTMFCANGDKIGLSTLPDTIVMNWSSCQTLAAAGAHNQHRSDQQIQTE